MALPPLPTVSMPKNYFTLTDHNRIFSVHDRSIAEQVCPSLFLVKLIQILFS